MSEYNKKNLVTKLPDEDVVRITEHYDVGKFKTFQTIAGGLANTNCRLDTDKGTFLFKICDEKTYEELLIQVEFLLHVRKYGFFTAFPHPKKNENADVPSSYIYRDGNLRIYDFMEGSPKKFKEVTPRIMQQLGVSLAKLHQIPILPSLPPLPFGVDAIGPFLQQVKGTKHENHPFVIHLGKQIERLKPLVQDATLPQGMVHGDLFADNALFKGEELISIVDWEEVSHGPVLIDIAMTILGCCYPFENTLDKPLMNAFLAAYDTIRPLTSTEQKYLDDFIDYAALTTAFWRFRQFQVRSPDPILADKYIEMEQRIQKPIK